MELPLVKVLLLITKLQVFRKLILLNILTCTRSNCSRVALEHRKKILKSLLLTLTRCQSDIAKVGIGEHIRDVQRIFRPIFNATDVSKPSGTVSATTLAPVTIINPSSLTAAATVPAARMAGAPATRSLACWWRSIRRPGAGVRAVRGGPRRARRC